VAEFAKEMEDKGLGKPKVSLQFELSQSGITELVKAEAAVEETYTVEEEEEVDDDEADAEAASEEEKKEEATTEEGEAKTEGEKNETKTEEKPAKKKKTIKVEKVSVLRIMKLFVFVRLNL
jgi:hypoxia up-regulated 1